MASSPFLSAPFFYRSQHDVTGGSTSGKVPVSSGSGTAPKTASAVKAEEVKVRPGKGGLKTESLTPRDPSPARRK